jgi:hypothetical protein
MLARPLDGDVALLAAHRREAPVEGIRLALPADVGLLGDLRERLSAWLDSLDVAVETLTALPLVVTELASNAVEHAYADADVRGEVPGERRARPHRRRPRGRRGRRALAPRPGPRPRPARGRAGPGRRARARAHRRHRHRAVRHAGHGPSARRAAPPSSAAAPCRPCGSSATRSRCTTGRHAAGRGGDRPGRHRDRRATARGRAARVGGGARARWSWTSPPPPSCPAPGVRLLHETTGFPVPPLVVAPGGTPSGEVLRMTRFTPSARHGRPTRCPHLTPPPSGRTVGPGPHRRLRRGCGALGPLHRSTAHRPGRRPGRR